MKLTKEDFERSLKITKISAAAMGVLLHPKQKPISQFILIISKIYYIICFAILGLTVVAEVADVFKSLSINFLAVTHSLPCVCYGTISLCKIASLSKNLKRSEQILDKLEELWPNKGLNKDQTAIVTKYMENGNSAQKTFTIINLLFVCTFNVSSVIVLIIHYVQTGVVLKTLPYYLPFDTTGKYIYPIAYLFNVAAGYIAGIGMIAPDTFFVTTISHICTQFKLLQYRIQNLVEDFTPDKGVDVNNNYHQEMYQALIECIKRHSELIELTNTIEDIFSTSILVNFLGSSVMICCVGFQSTAATGMELVVFLLFLIVSLIQTFILCWAGNQLIDTSIEIADAAYNSSWYLMDKKYRQLIFIMMQRAQRPQMITAMRFSVVSLKSFSSILSSAYSYFTLLQTAYKEN